MKKDKGSSISSVAVVVLIVLLLGGAYWNYQNKKEDNFFGGNKMQQNKKNNIDHKCSEDFQKAITSLDASFCEMALPTGDGSQDPSSLLPYYGNYCRELCLREVAFVKDEINLCSSISHFDDVLSVDGFDDPRESGSHRDHCMIDIAKKTKDTSVCRYMESDWAKINCPMIVGGTQ